MPLPARPPLHLRSRGVRWALGAAAWTLVGIFFATQTHTAAAYVGRPLTWAQAFAVTLTAWYIRAAFSPLVFLLARRFPLAGRAWPGRLLFHLCACLVLAGVQQLVYERAVLWLDWIPPRAMSPVEVHTNLLTYWVIVLLAYAADVHRRAQARELAASRLESQLARARLELLEAQLRPHFLFNTLNTVSELMHEDVDRADETLDNLSELLRMALRGAGRREVPLGYEVDFLRRYLEIEQTRFHDRLTVELDIAPDAASAPVPFLILQPLVENAVRHGVAPRASASTIQVRARRLDGRVRVEVCDDGPGVQVDGAPGTGIGLANTRARLEQSYGGGFRLELSPRPGGGTCALLEIPGPTSPLGEAP